MGLKICLTGIVMMMIAPIFGLGSILLMAGGVVAIVGCVMLFLDK